MKFDEVPKMATIKETAKIFNLPEYFVRQFKMFNLNLNAFAEKLNVGNISADEEEKETVIGIRPIH